MEQADLLGFVVGLLERLGIDYAVVGSFASSIWGEPRFTQYIDIVVQLSASQVAPLLAGFSPDDYYVSESAALEGVRLARPFNVIHFSSANKVDFMVVGDAPWAKAQIERRLRLELLPGVPAFVATPEDVIIGKLIYYREGGSDKHLADITGMLKHCGENIDRAYVAKYAHANQVADVWTRIAG